MPRPATGIKRPSKSVTLNAQSIKLLNALGEGNLSQGIEIALQGYIAFRSMTGMEPIRPLDTKPLAPKKKKK